MLEKFEDLVGHTITKIVGGKKGDRAIEFTLESGEVYVLHHLPSCCEEVQVEDIDNDIEVLLNSPVLYAYESTDVDNCTQWTFYRIGTEKGGVVIRWLGESNGYYSMGVDFFRDDQYGYAEK